MYQLKCPLMEQIWNSVKLYVGKLGRKRTLGGLGLDVRIIMNLSNIQLGLWTGLNWLRIGLFADSCEHGNEM
jgi:hypothetical protein